MKHQTPVIAGFITDGQLASRAQQGDLDSFEQLVCRYHQPLVCFLRYFGTSASDPEDVAQEAFLLAWQNLHQFDPQRSFKPWLYTIARHFLARTARRRQPRHSIPPTLADHQAGPQQQAESKEQRSSLWETIRRVTNETEFFLIWLHYAERLPATRIAEVLDMSPAACKMRLSRLRDRLRRHLRPFVTSSSDWSSCPQSPRAA